MILVITDISPCLHIFFVTVNAACLQISEIKMHSKSYSNVLPSFKYIYGKMCFSDDHDSEGALKCCKNLTFTYNVRRRLVRL